MSRACPTSTVPTAERAAGEAAALRPHRAPECSRTRGQLPADHTRPQGSAPQNPQLLGTPLLFRPTVVVILEKLMAL